MFDRPQSLGRYPLFCNENDNGSLRRTAIFEGEDLERVETSLQTDVWQAKSLR